jgi:hypothetical protein
MYVTTQAEDYWCYCIGLESSVVGRYSNISNPLLDGDIILSTYITYHLPELNVYLYCKL